jgi:hypothetical protein
MAFTSQITSRPDSEKTPIAARLLKVVENVKQAGPSTIVELIAGDVE